jgi:hypothetical protein
MAKWQFHAHTLATGLLVLAVLWPAVFYYPAAVAASFSAAWLARNVIAAVNIYRRHALPDATKLH